ncbi:cytochrome c oxidase assembly protein [Gryllotalpicola ginsengisoli]|uniref:cytochrome c oxidase assembly protein n=1 Tax=Gryllotalpicola ginsengisoli TaxID=444608 RepID=UPI0003B6592B|nr:cytochrome c oxidase assembly protein [Gryllotalpicola ginsengisoli]
MFWHERSEATPSIPQFLGTWSFDPVAAGAIVVAAVLYGYGVVVARRHGHPWRLWHTLAFYLLGLGSFAWIQFGFLGTWSHDLRWAFTTRVAFLLFLTPMLMALGAPLTLARAALTGRALAALEALMRSLPVRLMGNAIFAPLLALAGFSLFLTHLAAPLRLDEGWAVAITLLVPLGGLLMTLPIAEDTRSRTSLFIMYEFLLSLVELMMDAIPGIFLRLHDSVLDGAAAITHTAWGAPLPAWFPSPLHDQHLSGDFLWFIAEIADLPVLIALFTRWTHVDRRDAKQVDELSDEEYEAAVRAHLGR